MGTLGAAALNRALGLTLGFVTIALLALANPHPTPYNNYALLADAFLHKRTWIDWPGAYIDALPYAGRRYIIEAPLPAVLLMPAVAIYGTAATQKWLASLLAGVAVATAYGIARRLDVPVRSAIFLCGFLLLGTDLFWCAMFGDVWFLAHVAAVAMTLLAIGEILGARRPWLVALFAAAAVESRFTLVLVLPIYALMLWFGSGFDHVRDEVVRGVRVRRVIAFCATLAPFVVLWISYNEARWGVPYDIGYTAWFHQDTAGEPTGSPFALRYLSEQLYSFFGRAPDYRPAYPYLFPSIAGVALTYTSPGLIAIAGARGAKRLIAFMLAAAILTAIPNFMYYVNGYAQFGMRHALDFEPFLFVLLALAARRGIAWWAGLLYAYSMVVGAWGCWFWRAFIRT